MKTFALIGLIGLTGCAHVFPVAMYEHVSNPNAGANSPHPEVCDPAGDFGGFGIGLEAGNNRFYAALGQKKIWQCGVPDSTTLGASAVYIHEFRGRE